MSIEISVSSETLPFGFSEYLEILLWRNMLRMNHTVDVLADTTDESASSALLIMPKLVDCSGSRPNTCDLPVRAGRSEEPT